MPMKSSYKWGIICLLVLLLVGGFISWSFFRLSFKEKSANVDLLSLVPDRCDAILEAEHIVTAFKRFSQCRFYEDYRDEKFFSLLDLMMDNYDDFTQEQGHGSGSELSALLVSFHRWGEKTEQVIYGSIDGQEQAFIEKLLGHVQTASYVPRSMLYKEETIWIYPLGTGFLACYFQPGFFAMSFQKRLIEQVIDAYREGYSVLSEPDFQKVRKQRKYSEALTLYVRQNAVGPMAERLAFHGAIVPVWNRFDLRMNEKTVSLTNDCLEKDPLHTAGRLLTSVSASVLPEELELFYQFPYDSFGSSESKNTELIDGNLHLDEFLENHARYEVDLIVFKSSGDSAVSRQILLIPLNGEHVERQIRLLPMAVRCPSMWINGLRYPVWQFRNVDILHPYFVQSPQENSYYACLDDSLLVVGQSVETVYDYVLQRKLVGDVLQEKTPTRYEHSLNELAKESNMILIADMKRVAFSKNAQVYQTKEFLPSFFLDHKDFFSNFIFSTQLISIQGNFNFDLILNYQD